MNKEERGSDAEDDARLAEFAEQFEAGEFEVDGTSVVRLRRELLGAHTGLWRHVMGDRLAPELYGRAVREAVVVAYECDGELLGVVLTSVGALSASNLEKMEEQVRVFAAGEWGLEIEDIQVTLRLVVTSEVEASLVEGLFGV